MKSFLTFAEELKGKQHKIDADKDGKIEAEDLAKLRAMKKEETEQIDELKKSTLASYAKKASKDARIKSMVSKDLEHRSETSRKDSNKTSFSNAATDWKKKAWKREAGVNKAVDRLTKEEVAKATGDLKDACWKGYTAVGMKMKNGKKVPNCVPVKEDSDLEEKIDMNKASMGDVIKDFKKSDAPQFAGKSVEKRREMAIAAKLSADRGVREEVEQIDELDVKTLKSYVNKNIKSNDTSSKRDTGLYRATNKIAKTQATSTLDKKVKTLGNTSASDHKNPYEYEASRSELKNRGTHNFAGRKTRTEEVEQIDELDVKTLKSYVNKNLKSGGTSSKRDDGLYTATKKIAQKQATSTLDKKVKKLGNTSSAAQKNPYEYEASRSELKNRGIHNFAGRRTRTEVKEGVFGALAGGVLGGLAGGPLGAAAGAYLGHKAQQAGNNAKEVNKKLKKEEVEQIDELSFNTLASYASKVDQKDKQPLSKKRQAGYNSAVERMSKAAQTADLKKWGKISDSVEYNFDNEGNLMPNPVSFKQFLGQLDEIKMADLPSRKVSGRGYGTEYYKKEAEKDKSGYDDEKKEKSEVKRGRGRPVGSTSGARQKGSTTGKKRSGVEMTGYPLHLPNKN